jgi:hypothetical protein
MKNHPVLHWGWFLFPQNGQLPEETRVQHLDELFPMAGWLAVSPKRPSMYGQDETRDIVMYKTTN